MNTSGPEGDQALQDIKSTLARRNGAASELSALYNELLLVPPDDYKRSPLATRWFVVHRLGELVGPVARDTLRAVATSALPDPANSQHVYAAEYTIRLRAIDGLRKHGDVASLQMLYRQGPRELEGPAAVALHQLGHAPPGVRPVDPRTVLGSADPTDHHPKSDRPQDPRDSSAPPVAK